MLVREHSDSSLSYLRYKTFDIDTSQDLFQINVNSVQKTIILEDIKEQFTITIPNTIQDVFVTYLNKLKEYKENLEHPIHRASHLKSFR